MKTWRLVFREVDRSGFEKLRSGEKIIETRAATPKYQGIAVGDEITFVCGEDSYVKTVSKRYRWKSIDEMVNQVPFKEIMPTATSEEDMRKEYSSYPGYDEKIKEFGLVGFEFKE